MNQQPKKSLFDFGLVTHPEPVTKLLAGQQLLISPTIPYEQVLDAIQWSINYILDDRTFISAPLEQIITDVALVRYWSNLNTAEVDTIEFDSRKMYEFYDAVTHFEILKAVKEVVSTTQQKFFVTTLRRTLKSLVDYRNSAAGIYDRLSEQSATQKYDLDAVLQTLQDPEQVGNLQKIFDTFGAEALSNITYDDVNDIDIETTEAPAAS